MATKKSSAKKPAAPATRRAVLVTTANRGVFFGHIDAAYKEGDATAKLYDARNCIYWSRACGGFMGLAANGPIGDSRVGAKANIEVRNITSVTEVTAEAAKVWNEKPVWT